VIRHRNEGLYSLETAAGQRPNIGKGQAPGTVTGRGAASDEAGIATGLIMVAVAGFAIDFPPAGFSEVRLTVGLGAVFFCATGT
jgi:hypothetical protein